MSNGIYTTTGKVYDFIVEKCPKNGMLMSFPETIAAMSAQGLLQETMPDSPPFHAGMTTEEFIGLLRQFRVDAAGIANQARLYPHDPVTQEHAMFPMARDVFCIVNMPYMAEYPHYHDFFEITYVVQGACTFLFENESAALSKGDLCIVSHMSGHSLPIQPGCIAISVVVRKSTFNAVFGNLLTKKDLLSLFFRNGLYESRRANYILLKTGNDPLTFTTLQELAYETNLLSENSNACAGSLLNLFLARALRAATIVSLHHYEGYSEQDFDFTLVLQYIQQNYRTVTLASLADAFHFSQTYLSKLIRKQMNQTFTDVLCTLRMNHALEYLMNTSMKVSEIAQAVGYDSVDHFSRTFRKTYGLPPQEYKKQHRLSSTEAGSKTL